MLDLIDLWLENLLASGNVTHLASGIERPSPADNEVFRRSIFD